MAPDRETFQGTSSSAQNQMGSLSFILENKLVSVIPNCQQTKTKSLKSEPRANFEKNTAASKKDEDENFIHPSVKLPNIKTS